MPSHTFSSIEPLIRVPLQPPIGATAVIIRAKVTKGPEPPADETARLFHLRLAMEGKVRETQIVELIYRDRLYTVGFSGFGGGKKAMESPENKLKLRPFHIGPVAAGEIPVEFTVPLRGEGEAMVRVGPKLAVSHTEITPGAQPMELLLGFQGEGDLRAPVGWTISWEDDAVEWVGATSGGPVAPPIIPPSAPVPPAPPAPPPPVAPPAASPGTGGDPRAAAIALALQAILPSLPAQEAAALQALLPALLSGERVNPQTLILALLPIVMGGK